MKVILSEEQIKKILNSSILREEEMSAGSTSDPISMIKNASNNIDNILSLTPVYATSDDNANDDGSYNNNSGYTGPSGNSKAWLNTVKATFNNYKRKFGNQYNQNDTIGQDRADCSGFVYSALRNAGYNVGNGNTSTMIKGQGFTNAISGGFRRISWNGPADASKLPPGTILAFSAGENGKRYGHTIILGDNRKSYDYGRNKHTEYSPNLNLIYTAAWVPIA